MDKRKVIIVSSIVGILVVLVALVTLFGNYLGTRAFRIGSGTTIGGDLLTTDLEPGEYELIFEAAVRDGETISTRTSFIVDPTSPPPPPPYGTGAPATTPTTSSSPVPSGAVSPLPTTSPPPPYL